MTATSSVFAHMSIRKLAAAFRYLDTRTPRDPRGVIKASDHLQQTLKLSREEAMMTIGAHVAVTWLMDSYIPHSATDRARFIITRERQSIAEIVAKQFTE